MRLLAGQISVSKGARGGIVVVVISAWAEVVVAEVGRGIIVMEVGGGREGSLECLIYIQKSKKKSKKKSQDPSLPPVRKGVTGGRLGEDGKRRKVNFLSR